MCRSSCHRKWRKRCCAVCRKNCCLTVLLIQNRERIKEAGRGAQQAEKFHSGSGGTLPLGYEKRQELLEADSLTAQYEILMKILLYETNIQQIKNELQEKVKERIDQNQREYILREEMKSFGRNWEKIIPLLISGNLRNHWRNWRLMTQSKSGSKKKLPGLKMWQTARQKAV